MILIEKPEIVQIKKFYIPAEEIGTGFICMYVLLLKNIDKYEVALGIGSPEWIVLNGKRIEKEEALYYFPELNNL